MRFKQISIVGVGLIGGSFALAVRRAGLAAKIKGYDDKTVIDKALSLGIIDEFDRAIDEGRESEADLIYLAAPVGNIINYLTGNLAKKGAIITDAGSTKKVICQVARESLPDGVEFVGGHPMAGSHKSGIEFATADLFCDAPYAIIIDDDGSQSQSSRASAVNEIAGVVRAIGARPVMLTADSHDRAVARISHVPQLLSVCLALSVNKQSRESLSLAGSGFADMTRLAESNWSVWEDICKTNAGNIEAALNELIARLEEIRDSVASAHLDHARRAFIEANDFIRDFQSPVRKR